MRASPCAHLPCMMGNVEKLTIPCIDSTECLRKFVWIECMRVVYFLMPTPKFSLRTQNCENFCGTFSTLSERFPSAHFHPWGICNCQWLRRPLGSLRGKPLISLYVEYWLCAESGKTHEAKFGTRAPGVCVCVCVLICTLPLTPHPPHHLRPRRPYTPSPYHLHACVRACLRACVLMHV